MSSWFKLNWAKLYVINVTPANCTIDTFYIYFWEKKSANHVVCGTMASPTIIDIIQFQVRSLTSEPDFFNLKCRELQAISFWAEKNVASAEAWTIGSHWTLTLSHRFSIPWNTFVSLRHAIDNRCLISQPACNCCFVWYLAVLELAHTQNIDILLDRFHSGFW